MTTPYDTIQARNALGHFGIDGALLRALVKLDSVSDRAVLRYKHPLNNNPPPWPAPPGWVPPSDNDHFGFTYGWPWSKIRGGNK